MFPGRSGSEFRPIGVHDDDDVDDGDDDDNDDGDDVDGAALCFLHMRRSMHMVIMRVRASTERWPHCGTVQARCDSVQGMEKKKSGADGSPAAPSKQLRGTALALRELATITIPCANPGIA